MTQDIQSRVLQILVEELELPETPAPDARLVEDLSCDSLDTLEVAMAIEEVFAQEISDDEMESWTTVADIVATLEASR